MYTRDLPEIHYFIYKRRQDKTGIVTDKNCNIAQELSLDKVLFSSFFFVFTFRQHSVQPVIIPNLWANDRQSRAYGTQSVR